MQTASGLPIRKRIRLRNFHYGGGCAYYLTICTYKKQMLFGECIAGVVSLNRIGELVRTSWLATEALRPGVVLDEFIVMPNHMHAIIHLPFIAEPEALFGLVGGFKSHVTSAARAMLSDPDLAVWQKRFNDRIIRSGCELEHFRQYIRANPARWCGSHPGFRTAQPCPTLPI